MSVGLIIAKKRREFGWSQTDLANKAGLKPPTISQYESGVRSPSYEALIKLSNAFGVTTDYLITGEEISESIIDPQTKIFMNILKYLSPEKKEQLLQQAYYIANGYYFNDLPVLNKPADYADYILKKYSINELPIDVYSIAEKLNIKVLINNLGKEAEGILYKGKKNLIIINSSIKNEDRKKFTVSILIGHVLIPWHLQSQYSRKSESTLLTENIQEIEANEFAATLIAPRLQLQRDFIKNNVCWENIKQLAMKKYAISAFSLANCLVNYSKDHYAVIQSESFKIIKTFQGNRPIKNEIHPESFAASFFTNPPEQEEIRNGIVPARFWIEDAKPDETLYEDSIYNPIYGKVLTLLVMK